MGTPWRVTKAVTRESIRNRGLSQKGTSIWKKNTNAYKGPGSYQSYIDFSRADMLGQILIVSTRCLKCSTVKATSSRALPRSWRRMMSESVKQEPKEKIKHDM